MGETLDWRRGGKNKENMGSAHRKAKSEKPFASPWKKARLAKIRKKG